MGLIRSLAKRALETVVGKTQDRGAPLGADHVPAPRSPSAASGSGRPPPPKLPGREKPAAAPPAAAAAPVAAPVSEPAVGTPAVQEAEKSTAKAGKASKASEKAAEKAARPRRAVRPEDEAAAALLANLEAGAQEVKERMDAGEPVLLLDVREPFETAGGIIPGAVLVPLGQLPARWQELAGANEIVCYCAAGVRSVQAATLLREKGLFNATSLVGGISEWMQLGGKIVRPG